MQDVFSYIRQARSEYETRDITLFEGKEYSQYKTINQIDHYWMDSYVDDAWDEVIGGYPFDNITKFRVLLEARATDFDTRSVEVFPRNGSRRAQVSAMVATKAVQSYMRKTQFDRFLNDLCITRAKYGGVLVKNTAEGLFVVPWQNVITDQSDIMAGIRIERHYMTPSEMMEKKGGWENVKDAIETAENMRSKDIGRSDASESERTQGDLIEVYELQGNVTRGFLKRTQAMKNDEEYESDEDEDHEYVEARIIACGVDWTEKEEDTTSQQSEDMNTSRGVVLYANEEKSTHRYLARNPIAGRGLGEGVIESLFEHQKWHNFTKTEEMRMIAIAGKKLYVTDDPDVLANIFDEGVDHGTVLRVDRGNQFTELNQLPTGVPLYQNIRTEWDESASRTTSSFDAKIGEEAKSGTPFRAQYLQNIEASSQFKQYHEEIGSFVEELITEFMLKDALDKAKKDDEVYETFTMRELQLIDETLVQSRVTDEFARRSLEGEVITPETLLQITRDVEDEVRKKGNKRTIKHIKKFIEEAGSEVVIHTTDEAQNKSTLFESYYNVIALLPPNDARRDALIDRVMEMSGIPREEIELYLEQNRQSLAGAQQGQQGATPDISLQAQRAENTPGAQLAA